MGKWIWIPCLESIRIFEQNTWIRILEPRILIRILESGTRIRILEIRIRIRNLEPGTRIWMDLGLGIRIQILEPVTDLGTGY